MVEINRLSSVTSLTAGDLLPVWSSDNSDTRRASLTTLMDFIESNFASPDFTVQTAVPLSGATQTIGGISGNVWLQVRPAGTIASLTIALPPSTSAADGQQVIVTTSQNISGTLTFTSSGATVSGVPSNAPANSSVIVRYDSASLTWFVVAQGGDVVNLSTSQTLTNKSLTEPRFTTTVVGSLPSAISSQGKRTFVTDANTTMTLGIGAAVVGGGANVVPVYSDGGSWRIG